MSPNCGGQVGQATGPAVLLHGALFLRSVGPVELQTGKSQTLLWKVSGCPYQVTVPTTVLQEIRSAAVEGFHSVPHGGIEVGGIFFGICVGDFLHIRSHRPIICQYLTGPSFKLSMEDQMGLAAVLDSADSDPELAGLVAIGWYHSHTRSEICLSPEDLQLYGEFFPERWQIALVLRPANLQPTRAGFFFRDFWGGIKADAPVHEFILEPPGYGLTFLGPEAENAVAKIVASHGIETGKASNGVFSGAQGAAADVVDRREIETAASAPVDEGGTGDAALVSPSQYEAGLTGVERAPRDAAARSSGGTITGRDYQKLVPLARDAAETGWRSRWVQALKRLISPDRRSTGRQAGDGLMAFYWDGGYVRAHRVRDISRQGAFIETQFPWTCGTLISLTLQISSRAQGANERTDAIVVPAEVVRTSPEGMGLRFTFLHMRDVRELLRFLSRWNPNSAQLSLKISKR